VAHSRELTFGEEVANAITHGVGLLAAIAGFPLLVVSAQERGDPLRLVGVCIFATTLIMLYGASTLYHAVPLSSPKKRIMRVIDHSAIYLLIAGTYTPFTFGVLRGVWGWTIFALVWVGAGLGILFKTTLGFKYPKASTIIYIAMGWLGVLAIKPMVAALPAPGLWLIFAGGAAYTGGVVFYVWHRPRYMHAVWHIFVMAGSICHWCAVYWYA
jgi:hemolysin III